MFIMNSFFMKVFLLLSVCLASSMIASGVPEESFWDKFNAAAKKSWDNAVNYSSAILKSDEISNHISALNESFNDASDIASRKWNEYNISSKFETASNSTTTFISDIINNPHFLTIVIIVVISVAFISLLWFGLLPLLGQILLGILRCLGFSIIGPVKGTCAALWMSCIQPVAQGSCYAIAQSFAMLHKCVCPCCQ